MQVSVARTAPRPRSGRALRASLAPRPWRLALGASRPPHPDMTPPASAPDRRWLRTEYDRLKLWRKRQRVRKQLQGAKNHRAKAGKQGRFEHYPQKGELVSLVLSHEEMQHSVQSLLVLLRLQQSAAPD